MSRPGVPLVSTFTPPPGITAGVSKPGVPLVSTFTPPPGITAGVSRPGVPLISTFTPPLGITAGVSNPGVPLEATHTPTLPLNPFKVPDDLISLNIISIHEAHQAVRQDVDSLFDFVSDIVISSSTNFGDYLGLKQVTVDFVEDKVPNSALRPTYTLLKEIACQMTCHSFNISNAHESVVGVLQKLKSYTWDAKAVIALSAFALDYGETWRLTLKQATRKDNALELHAFRLAEEEKKPAQSDSNLTKNLVKITLELIKGIITLEKLLSNKTYAPNDVPTLLKAPRDVYTYWAVLSLFACANQLDWDIKNNVIGRLNFLVTQLNADLSQINREIEALKDLIWRFDAFRIPSGIWQLLQALIYAKDVDQPVNIFANNATKESLTLGELITTQNLFLFISGVDNIDPEIIKSLKLIHESITNNDKYKKGNKIVWVPVVEHWTDEIKKKFEHLKSMMPSLYVVECSSLIKGYKPLQVIWNYQGKPILVVADARGKLLNQNALYPISVWGMQAFPFDPATIATVSQNWNWFWSAVYNIHPHIFKENQSEEKYVFVYGGTCVWSEKFHGLLEGIKKDLEETKTYIEHFNLAKTETKIQTEFWLRITHSLLSNTQNIGTTTFNEIQMFLAMKNVGGWAIVSKGKNVFLIGYNEVMLNVLEGFKEWQTNISVSGFASAINDYYFHLHKTENRPCMKFRFDNIHSRVLIPFYCPDQTCGRMMEINSVSYKCCHGMHFVDDDDLPIENGKRPRLQS